MTNIPETVKRWMAMVLACVMVFTLCPTAVFANDNIRTDICVSNIQLSDSTIYLNGITDEQYITITADVTVPEDFDGSKPFYFWFQEQVIEYQCRGYDEVFATQDANGDWKINGQIKIWTWWPEGVYELDYVTYENHDQKVTHEGTASLEIDRTAVADNTDPVVTDISIFVNDEPLTDSVLWESKAELKIRVAVTDDHDLTEHGNMILRNHYGARYEASTDYVYTEIKDDNGTVTGYTREMVLTVNTTQLKPGSWYIEHFTVDDVYGNYVFYNYNGDETDGDGTANGNDDLLDNVSFEIETNSFMFFFVNQNKFWNDENGFGMSVKDTDGEIVTTQDMELLEIGRNGWVWYTFVDETYWGKMASVAVCEKLDTESRVCESDQMTDDHDTMVLQMDDEGNFVLEPDMFGDKWLGGDDEDPGEDINHLVFVYTKDNSGNLHETEPVEVNDLSDLCLPFDVEPFVFPDDADALTGVPLEFVGWWVKESDQLLQEGDNQVINTNAHDIHVYPVYEMAPVRLQAHYVNEDGDAYVYTKWFAVEYGDTLGSIIDEFDISAEALPEKHTADHQFLRWDFPHDNTLEFTPDVEGAGYVAVYDELYFTIQYEYLGLVEQGEGLTAPGDVRDSVTIFVANVITEAEFVAYFKDNIAPQVPVCNGAEKFAQWNYGDYETSDKEVGNGNCYDIRLDMEAVALLMYNNENLWQPEGNLYVEVLGVNDEIIDSATMYLWGGSFDNLLWYGFLSPEQWENRETVKVYCGEDNQAASYTNAVKMPGNNDMVVLDPEQAPEDGVGEFGAVSMNSDVLLGGGEDDGGEGDGKRVVHVHSKNSEGTFESFPSYVGEGPIDLNELGLFIDVPTFEFQHNAESLAGTRLNFVGWWVKETGQLIKEGDGQLINLDAAEINLYAQYEKAPVLLNAHYVREDGNVHTYAKWFVADYADTLGSLNFAKPTDHFKDRTFVDWFCAYGEDQVLTPDLEHIVYVAEYDWLYYTINYIYLKDMEINGHTWPVWEHGSETVFVPDEIYSDLQVAQYFDEKIKNTITMTDQTTSSGWEYLEWNPDTDPIGFGNCYGIQAVYDQTMLYFANTNHVWDAENGFFLQILDQDEGVIANAEMQPLEIIESGEFWYCWVDSSVLENKEEVLVKVYMGSDETAANYTKPIQLPGEEDMVVLVVNDMPESGGFDAGIGHFDIHEHIDGGDHEDEEAPRGEILRVYDVTLDGDPNADITVSLVDGMSEHDFQIVRFKAKLDVSDDFNGRGGFDVGFGIDGIEGIINGFGAGNIHLDNEDGVWFITMDITMDYFIRAGSFKLKSVQYDNKEAQAIESNIRFTLDRSRVTDNELPVISAPQIIVTNDQDTNGKIVIRIPITDAHGSWIHDEELVLETDDPNVPEVFRRHEFTTRYVEDQGWLELTVDSCQLYAAQWYISELQISDSYGNSERYHRDDNGNSILQNTTFTVVDSDNNPYGSHKIYFFNVDNVLNSPQALWLWDSEGNIIADKSLTRIDKTPVWYVWANDAELLSFNNGDPEKYTAGMQVKWVDDQGYEQTSPFMEWDGDHNLLRRDPNGDMDWEYYDQHRDYADGNHEEEPDAEHHVVIVATVGENVEHLFDFHSQAAVIPVGEKIADALNEMSPEDADRLLESLIQIQNGYTFPEYANNGNSNKYLKFKGWYLPQTEDLFANIGDVEINTDHINEYEIHVVAMYEEVPMVLQAGHVNDEGKFMVTTKWYSVEHGTDLDEVLGDFEDILDQLTHVRELQNWQLLEEYKVRDNLATPELCALDFMAVYDRKYVTINYAYRTDLEQSKDVEAGGAITVFADDPYFANKDFTDHDVAQYFKDRIAGTLAHTTGKLPVWKYDQWLPSPIVSTNANCYGIYAEYSVLMTNTMKQETQDAINQAETGTTVDVDMKVPVKDEEGNDVTDENGDPVVETVTVIPSGILQTAKDKNVDVSFNMGAYSWTVAGDSIQENAADVNLGVQIGGEIPEKAQDSLGKTNGDPVWLSIAHDGEFGFDAQLTIPLHGNDGEEDGPSPVGMYASLYYYEERTGRMLYQGCMQIQEDRNVTFRFNHASDYVLVLSEEDPSKVAWVDWDNNGEAEEGELFDSLLEAFTAVNEVNPEEAVTVTILRNFETNDQIVLTGKILLDLNGHTIVGASSEKKDHSMIHNKGELNILNGEITYNYSGEAGNYGIGTSTIVNAGYLTIENSTIRNTTNVANHCGYAVDNNSTTGNAILVINEGSVIESTGVGYDSIRQFANSEECGNEVIIQGGSVGNIWQQNPSDGADGRNTKDPMASLTISGGEVGSVFFEPNANASLSIENGVINSVGTYDAGTETDISRIPANFVSGGKFIKAPEASFISKESAMVKNDDGTFDTVRIEEFPADLVSYSLVLNGSIELKFYMELSEAFVQDETARIRVRIADGTVKELKVSDLVYQNDGQYTLKCPMAAKQMTEKVTLSFVYNNGGSYSGEFAYSVKGYTDIVLNEAPETEDDERLHELLKAMLRYGASAQEHFEYNQDVPANEGIDDVELDSITDSTLEDHKAVLFKTETAQFTNVNLTLESQTTLRFFFSVSTETDFTVYYGNEEVKYESSENGYYVEVPNIAAQDLDAKHTFTVRNGDVVLASVEASALTYCYSTLWDVNHGKTASEKLVKLVQLLYLYNQAADGYFENM